MRCVIKHFPIAEVYHDGFVIKHMEGFDGPVVVGQNKHHGMRNSMS